LCPCPVPPSLAAHSVLHSCRTTSPAGPPSEPFFLSPLHYLLSVICLPFLLCVCPLTGLCRKSITCNCRASARLASHAPPTPPVSDRPLVSPRAVDKPRHLTEPNPTLWSESARQTITPAMCRSSARFATAGAYFPPLRTPPSARPHPIRPEPPFSGGPAPHATPWDGVQCRRAAPVVVSGTALRVHGSSL
jgi:hypothetical protein